MKKLLPLLALLAVLLCGCTPPSSVEDPTDPEPVTLIYYTIGTPDADLELVGDALNELLLERYGFRVDYRKIDWNDYTAQLNAVMSTGQTFDVAFTWTEDYIRTAQAGYLLDLTEYLNSDAGSSLFQAVDPRFWEGVTINDSIWGVPTNKELATPLQFLFSQELIEKYNIDISACTDFASLEPLLEQISRLEPDCIPLCLDTGRVDLSALGGYSYLTGDTVPLVVHTGDESCTIINLFETEFAMDTLRTLHSFYQKGYINQDAPVRTALARFQDEKVFCRLSCGGPDSSDSYSTDFGYPIVAVQVSEAIVTSASTQGGIMVINAGTAHPQEALTFLTAVNTDPDVRNLLKFGVEGIHYTLTADDQVEIISDAYRGVPYTQGNWFILKTTVGERPDKWDIYREFNASASSSPLLGFNPDYSACESVYNAVSQVYSKYYVALMTGAVDPDQYVPLLNSELEAAGIDTLIENVQSQVDTWLNNKAG